MNRNHQSGNNINHTARGRENMARKQFGRSARSSLSFNPKEAERKSINFNRSNFNRPAEFNRNEIPYQDWISSTEDANYDNYRSDGPGPVEIEAKEKYMHDSAFNFFNDHHGRDFSYRARSEMNEVNNEDYIRSYEGIGPKGYTRSDESISDEVCRMLSDSNEIDASKIHVGVESGIVMLSGVVTNRLDKFSIEDLIENVTGVSEIQNDIKVIK